MNDRPLDDQLPSWRPGPTREAVTGFLDAAAQVPPTDRVAYFDNDGTLWCERPNYPQLEFFTDALRQRSTTDPDLVGRPEFAAVLAGDMHAVGDIGLERVAMALVSLFESLEPAAFEALVNDFMDRARHADLGRPMRAIVYRPMLELIDELRRLDFTVGIVTGGGTEFVRAISSDLYGVPPELVVGTLIGSEFGRDADGRVSVRRTASLLGDPNEGAAKVTNIQTQLGRAPIFAAGNSGGDREMLEWATASTGPNMALLVDHDDADREYEYVSVAQTFDEPEPITTVAERLGWTVVSMRRDWSTVFPPVSDP